MDYDDEAAERVFQAKSDFLDAIYENDFPTLLQQYNNDIFEINIRTTEHIKYNLDAISHSLLQVQESANSANADITECSEDLNIPTLEELFQTYSDDCASPATAVGSNLVAIGTSKRDVIAAKKYNDLMNYFHGCITPNDPVPRICAGAIESTYLELERIIPGIKANHLQIERELKQQILALSGCAYEYVSVVNKRLQTDFSSAKTCILDKINTA